MYADDTFLVAKNVDMSGLVASALVDDALVANAAKTKVMVVESKSEFNWRVRINEKLVKIANEFVYLHVVIKMRLKIV